MLGMGLKFTTVIGRHLLHHLSMFGVLLGLIASLNNPNRGFNPPQAAHLLTPPTSPLLTHRHPYTCHS